MTDAGVAATARDDEFRAVAAPRSPWWDRALSRVGLISPLARDGLLAVSLAAASVLVLIPLLGLLADDIGAPFTAGQQQLVLALVAIQALLLWIRRVRPVSCLLLVALVQVAIGAVVPPGVTARVGATLIAAYTVGALVGPPRLVRAVLAAVLLEIVGRAVAATLLADGLRSALAGDAPEFTVQPVTWPVVREWAVEDFLVVLLYLSAVLAGVWVASRREYLELVKVRAASAIREQRARADVAVESERLRMARELHDIAAHHLSGLVVQASAVERLIDHDPDRAKEGARSIRAQGKATLDNLRMVVGVLRERTAPGDASAIQSAEAGAPVPGLGMLDDLVASSRALGDRIVVSVDGPPAPIPPIADVSAYRIAQEALANARQHAPGQQVRLRLDRSASGVRLEVSNPVTRAPDGDREGFGLVGMRERAELAGGDLSAGRGADGVWRVTLSIDRAVKRLADSADTPDTAGTDPDHLTAGRDGTGTGTGAGAGADDTAGGPS